MHVRILASRHTAFYSPLLATLSGGFLERRGVEFTYGVLSPGQTSAGVIRGGIADVVQTAPSTNWAAMERGETGFPLNFALINQRDGFFLASRAGSATAFDWKSLEGKTLLADHGSQPLTMLRYAVKFNGADWQKIRVVNAGSADEMVQAFRNGTGDFVHLQAPAPHLLSEQGVGVVAVSVGASMPPNAFSSLCASRAFIDSPAFAAFFDAFAEAKAWVRKASAEEIASQLKPHFSNVSPPALLASVADYKRIGAWEGGAAIARDLYEQSLDVFETTGRITRRHPYEECCI